MICINRNKGDEIQLEKLNKYSLLHNYIVDKYGNYRLILGSIH